MKNLIPHRLAFRIFMTLLLTFSLQGIAGALVPETVVPQVLKMRTFALGLLAFIILCSCARAPQKLESVREIDPLPVELSHFRPARERSRSRFHLARERFTGAPIIAWTTESETNNAGFFIKRSQHRDGELKIINATLIPGAGTTYDKQSYTYTDTTTTPNGVYYYQLECVSIDGTRWTLTRPIRLKGHIGGSRRFEEAPF